MKGDAFSAAQARASLETSLRELQTDHIDFYLLHDYSVGDVHPDELLEFLDASVKAGKIGSYGIGTGFDQVLRALEREPSLCSVMQFQNSVVVRNIERLPPDSAQRLVITHGALAESYRRLARFLEDQKDTAKQWAAEIGCGQLGEETLSVLMLNYAVRANPNGLVLFSSRDPVRVTANANAVANSPFGADQISIFCELVKRESARIRATAG